MEALLKKACADHGLRCIGVNLFDIQVPDVTVYLHFSDGMLTSATASTFDDAVASAVLEANEKRTA